MLQCRYQRPIGNMALTLVATFLFHLALTLRRTKARRTDASGRSQKRIKLRCLAVAIDAAVLVPTTTARGTRQSAARIVSARHDVRYGTSHCEENAFMRNLTDNSQTWRQDGIIPFVTVF